ncbi:bifunctional oligoribonuclease/PAP phosphatase NrnA [Bacillus sp. H-16]|uniref:DHH family phosphoesterase n=1 Tax=Alteribacter salitolerans TaxID=2912333 RepID=UPI001963E64B|nr:bifunctional oligoribonuclease/PAP phosphatase NrnA [Alteribacter salitolerans]MBM7096454.1 bifunctional oligoribonuclease/PAP phosphatase NrnA [Alteribacter salitolerans]
MKQKIIEKIKKYHTIIIHRHVRPDPDAVGSQSGLKELIISNFPEKRVLLAGEDDSEFTYLAGMDKIKDDDYKGALVIVCDTANLPRVDDQRYELGEFLIKIDHHPEVDVYGDLSWVDITASSTSEMICELYGVWQEDGAVLSDEASRLLYAGIVGDTGRFRHPNTTKRTFYWAGKLIEGDFSRPELYNAMYEKNIDLVRMEGYVLSQVELKPSGAAFIKLPAEILKEYKVDAGMTASIVNSFSTLKGVKAWVFFVEEEEEIRVRLRSKGPVINDLAARYNGGGHPMASGATVYSWEEAERLLEELDQICTESE